MNKFMDKDWIEMNAKGLITKKLREIDEFEAKFRPNTASRAMYKWCTDYNYRKNDMKNTKKHQHKVIFKFTKAEIQRIEDLYWNRYNQNTKILWQR
jgi:hypothetical protein